MRLTIPVLAILAATVACHRSDVFASGDALKAREDSALDAPLTRTTAGLLGSPTDTVTTSDFFQFYHLQPTNVDNRADGHVDMYFQPAGGPFQRLTSVFVGSAQGHAETIALTLARSFVDDPANGKYARDIATHFLREVPAPEDRRYFGTLADEISGAAAGKDDIDANGHSREYNIFAGVQDSVIVMRPRTVLIVGSTEMDDGAPGVTLFFATPSGH
jgi:hypothetical protein